MRGSVIIPAHNEEALLPRCLTALAAQPGIEELEIVVVVNGSDDRTAEVARAHAGQLPGLVVIETPESGKSQALNLGDARASSFPRIYLDADIELSTEAVPSLLSALETELARVAAPHVRFDVDDSDRIVRDFYEVYRQLPYVTSGLIGLGVYALSESGRHRFLAFPDLMADDLFVQRLFRLDERLTVDGEYVVRAPRRWQDLLAVRTRAAKGAIELTAAASMPSGLDAASTSGSSTRALIRLLRTNPSLVRAVFVYAAITVAARLRARRTGQRWHRDESSRSHPD